MARRKRRTTGLRIWIRETQRCLFCRAPYPDPHHIRTKGMGGRKDEEAIDVENVVPVCRTCHTKGHQGSWEKLIGSSKIDLAREAVRVWARWEGDSRRGYFEALAASRNGD